MLGWGWYNRGVLFNPMTVAVPEILTATTYMGFGAGKKLNAKGPQPLQVGTTADLQPKARTYSRLHKVGTWM